MEHLLPERLLVAVTSEDLTIDDFINFFSRLWYTLSFLSAGYIGMVVYEFEYAEISTVGRASTICGLALNLLQILSIVVLIRNQSALFVYTSIGIVATLLVFDVAFLIFLALVYTWWAIIVFCIDTLATALTLYLLLKLATKLKTLETTGDNSTNRTDGLTAVTGGGGGAAANQLPTNNITNTITNTTITVVGAGDDRITSPLLPNSCIQYKSDLAQAKS